MGYRSFREFLSVAEEQGYLRRVQKSVDVSWEPAALAKWVFQALPKEDRFGLLFDNVEGSDFQLATGALGANLDAYALALGVPCEDKNKIWTHALNNPISPVEVRDAPCQEVVRTGDEVKLSDLPIPVWTPGKDVGPYITTITVTRDVDGAQNMGVYRTMVKDDNHVIANLSKGRQGFIQASTYLDQGKPAPIAWVIGTDPSVQYVAAMALPSNVQEIDVAGGVNGEGVEVVKCITNDLLVPANSEIIIEGEVLPGQYENEGPFGEFAGYMGPVAPKPLVRITAITHRRDAIYYGYTSQCPPSESTTVQSLTNEPTILKMIRDTGELNVKDLYLDLTYGTFMGHGIIALDTKFNGHAAQVGRLVAAMTGIKRVTVVDDDIDIRDPLHIEWAMNAHYHPIRDTILIDNTMVPMGMDPSVRLDNKHDSMGSKVVIDATATIDAGVISLPPKEIMMKALESWKESDLPEFEIPERVKLRLDNS